MFIKNKDFRMEKFRENQWSRWFLDCTQVCDVENIKIEFSEPISA